MTAPVFRNAVESHGPSAASVVITAPTLVSGDILLIAIGQVASGLGIITTLSGWGKESAACGGVIGAGAIGNIAVYSKLATGGEPPNYTWAVTGSSPWHAIAAAYSLADPFVPVDTAAEAVANSFSTTANGGAVTTSHADARVLTFIRWLNNSALTPCASPAMANRLNVYDASVGIGCSFALNDYAKSIAGSTGALNATIGTSARTCTSTITLNAIQTPPSFWTNFVQSTESFS